MPTGMYIDLQVLHTDVHTHVQFFFHWKMIHPAWPYLKWMDTWMQGISWVCVLLHTCTLRNNMFCHKQAVKKEYIHTHPSICRQMTWTDRAGAQFFFRWKMMHPYLRPQACRSAGEAWTATTKTSNTTCRHLQHNKRLCELTLVPFLFCCWKMIRMYICPCCGYVRRSAGAAHQRTYTCAVFFSSENDTHSMTVPQVNGHLDAGYFMGVCFTSCMHSERQHVFPQTSIQQKIHTYTPKHLQTNDLDWPPWCPIFFPLKNDASIPTPAGM